MKKEEIISLLSEWNFWGRGLETGKERTYTHEIVEMLEGKVNKIVSVFGVRRAGKSYILRQVAKRLSEKYGKKNVLYVNFEEIGLGERNVDLLNNIYFAYTELIRPQMKPFLLLDEIQEIKGWEKWVRSLHEKDAAKFVVSGSSAKLMSEELATLLAGRDVAIEVFPLDFKEYLDFKEIEWKREKRIINKKDIIISLREFLEFGGFPEIVETENTTKKKEILRRYYDTILIKDVQKRYGIRDVKYLEFLANYYLSNISALISFNRLSKIIRIPVKTVERYSKYLESSRMIFSIPKFSFSLKEREVAPRKIYSIDIGISNAVGFRFMENYGKLIENLVAISLLHTNANIFYFKDYQQREVDFVIKEGLEVKQLIQVTYASDKDEVEQREIRSLLKASDLLNCKNLLVITWDYEDEQEVKGKRIRFMPLWKWLLDVNSTRR